MAEINPNKGGVFVAGEEGMLWYVEVGTTVDPLADGPMPATAKYVGELSEDGVQIADNAEEGEDKSGFTKERFVAGKGTFAPTVTFTVFEIFGKNTMPLVTKVSNLVYDTEGELIGWDEDGGTPAPACLIVLGEKQDGGKERIVIWNAVHSTKEQVGGNNEDIRGFTLTRKLFRGGPSNTYYSHRWTNGAAEVTP